MLAFRLDHEIWLAGTTRAGAVILLSEPLSVFDDVSAYSTKPASMSRFRVGQPAFAAGPARGAGGAR